MRILKRISLAAALILLTALLCSCAMISAWLSPDNNEGGEPPHTHKWGSWITEITPTCDAGGQQVRLCACGERETETMDPTGAHVLTASNTCHYCGTALQPTEGLDFEALNDTTCEVNAIGHAEGTVIVIPTTHDGRTVTRIGADAFKEKTDLQRVILPNTLTSIEANAFASCTALTAIAIPTSVTYIKQAAFADCYALRFVNFGTGSKLKSIGANAFCYTDLQTLDFGDSSALRTIGNSSFYGCRSLSAIRFGKNSKLTTLDSYAFAHCTALSSVVLPDAVTALKSYAFYGCEKLTAIVIPKSIASIGNLCFSYCEALGSIYYCGTVTDWDRISIHEDVGYPFTQATVYYYSETEMPTGGNVKYWHYLPIPW